MARNRTFTTSTAATVILPQPTKPALVVKAYASENVLLTEDGKRVRVPVNVSKPEIGASIEAHPDQYGILLLTVR